MIGDTAQEPDETFAVNLSAAANATIFKAQGVGTILDDDTPIFPGATPTLSIDDVSVIEGNAGHDQRRVHGPAEHREHADRDRHRPDRQRHRDGSQQRLHGGRAVTLTFNPGVTTQPSPCRSWATRPSSPTRRSPST